MKECHDSLKQDMIMLEEHPELEKEQSCSVIEPNPIQSSFLFDTGKTLLNNEEEFCQFSSASMKQKPF